MLCALVGDTPTEQNEGKVFTRYIVDRPSARGTVHAYGSIDLTIHSLDTETAAEILEIIRRAQLA